MKTLSQLTWRFADFLEEQKAELQRRSDRQLKLFKSRCYERTQATRDPMEFEAAIILRNLAGKILRDRAARAATLNPSLPSRPSVKKSGSPFSPLPPVK